jgi:hypothetical protein
LVYADDGLIYSDLKENYLEMIIMQVLVPLFKEWGIDFNLEKSGFVKANGKFIKPLKFVGLEYDSSVKNGHGEYGVLRASTRKGATLVFDKLDLILEYHCNVLEGQDLDKPTEGEFYPDIRTLKRARMANSIWQELRKLLELSVEKAEVIKDFLSKHEDSWPTDVAHYIHERIAGTVKPLLNTESPILPSFEWSIPVKEGLFGWVVAKLYNDGWNKLVKQDFRLGYKIGSMAYTFLEEGFSPLLLQDGKVSDLEKIDRDNWKVFGYEQADPMNPRKWNFIPIGKTRFYEILKNPKNLEEKLLRGLLRIKIVPRDVLLSSFKLKTVNLSVFNISSYAFLHLVNILRYQGKEQEYRKILKEMGWTNNEIKVILTYLRKGLNFTEYVKALQKDPGLLIDFMELKGRLDKFEQRDLFFSDPGNHYDKLITAREYVADINDADLSFISEDWFDEDNK